MSTTSKQEIIDTPAATIERINEDLMVVRFKPTAVLNAKAIADNLEVRKRLATIPYAVISILPEEGDFDMSLFDQDHYGHIDPIEIMRVEAIVARDSTMRSMVQLFFAHYPQQRRAVQVFTHLQDAIIWVDERLAERTAKAGT